MTNKSTPNSNDRMLEEQFFAKQNQELMAKMRSELENRERADAIACVTGISDQTVVTAIAKLEVTVETLAAFRLMPLLAVAWADDRVDNSEREAVLQAASKVGLHHGDASYSLLKFWLEHRPSAEMFDTWKKYARSLKESLPPSVWSELSSNLLAMTKKVAGSAGGLLGIGSVSPAEAAILKHVEEALA